jgi:hypothetical protein
MYTGINSIHNGKRAREGWSIYSLYIKVHGGRSVAATAEFMTRFIRVEMSNDDNAISLGNAKNY